MKTIIRFAKSVALTLGLAAAFAGCGKTDSTPAVTPAYTYSNGVCYMAATGQQVTTNYCTATTSTYNTSMFRLNVTTCTSLRTGGTVNAAYCTSNPFVSNANGCLDSYSNQYVETAYCSMSPAATTGSTTGPTSQVCNGPYLYSNGYTVQQVTCNGQNCRGYTMYTVTTRQPVQCL